MTHAGFMFPVATSTEKAARGLDAAECDPRQLALTVAAVDIMMVKSEYSQWAGFRYLYLTAAGAAWIVGGEWAFLVACIGLIKWLGTVDKPPPLVYEGDPGYTI
eukprot:2452661-Pleurochrysis_carterae.AAC.1